MELAADHTLIDVADRLSADGYDTDSLRELQQELELLERPPGLIRRMTNAARNAAARHWANFVGELRESHEAMAIIAVKITGQRALTPEESDKVRAQLVDLVKVFPAGLIAAANSAFPVPGTGVFTPWILARLGLMPSRWREAHLLDQLREQQRRLRERGYNDEAEALAELEHQLEDEAEHRDHVGGDARLLTHWDANRNGRWDDDEKAAYLEELRRVRGLAERFGSRKQWFLEQDGEIFGAMRMSELLGDPDLQEHLHGDDLLVCFDGKTGWVALAEVLGREPRFGN